MGSVSLDVSIKSFGMAGKRVGESLRDVGRQDVKRRNGSEGVTSQHLDGDKLAVSGKMRVLTLRESCRREKGKSERTPSSSNVRINPTRRRQLCHVTLGQPTGGGPRTGSYISNGRVALALVHCNSILNMTLFERSYLGCIRRPF